MKVVDVTADYSNIVLFPDEELVEIIQNIRTILTTIKGTVPLDRDFGIDSDLVDEPMSIAQPLIIKEVKEKIELYEPRVRFISLSWSGNGMNGVTIPDVKVAII